MDHIEFEMIEQNKRIYFVIQDLHNNYVVSQRKIQLDRTFNM